MYTIKLFISFLQFFLLEEVNNDKEVEGILIISHLPTPST